MRNGLFLDVFKVQSTEFAIDDCITRWIFSEYDVRFLFSTAGSIRLPSTDGNGHQRLSENYLCYRIFVDFHCSLPFGNDLHMEECFPSRSTFI